MPAEIVTGYAGRSHVTAAQEGRRNAGTFGDGRYALDTGQGLAITVESANSVTVGTGDGIMDGRHVTVEVPTSLSVASGTQGVNRNDLVCVRYVANPTTGVETATLVVIQGTPTSGTAADPSYNSGSILEGAATVDWPLWRLPLAGVTVGTPVKLFDTISPLSALAQLLSTHQHSASDVASGTLPVARGGTGAASAQPNQVFAGPSVGSDASTPGFRALVASDIPGIPANKVTDGTLPVARGGTGLGSSPSMLVNLASASAANVLQASPRPGVTGALPVGHGGTGSMTAKAARKALGLSYAAGDTASGTIQTAGYLTGSSKSLIFLIPHTKVCDGTPGLTNCRLRVRQNNYYIVGDAESSANLTSASTIRETTQGWQVEVTLSSANSHATNNAPVGITCEYTVSIS